MLSLNDIITAAIAVAAVAVPAVGVYVTVNANRRAARSALTDLTMRIGSKADDIAKEQDRIARHQGKEERAFELSIELEVLVRQADDLVHQLRSKFPEAVGITIAQALELVSDYWYADRYWALACATSDPILKARTVSYWGYAQLGVCAILSGRVRARAEHGRGRRT